MSCAPMAERVQSANSYRVLTNQRGLLVCGRSSEMCNDFGNRVSYAQYVDGFSQLKLPVRFNPARPNLEPRDEIWPTETAPVLQVTGEGLELSSLRWGLAAKLGAKPVINMRSEGKRFEQGRCLVPAS